MGDQCPLCLSFFCICSWWDNFYMRYWRSLVWSWQHRSRFDSLYTLPTRIYNCHGGRVDVDIVFAWTDMEFIIKSGKAIWLNWAQMWQDWIVKQPQHVSMSNVVCMHTLLGEFLRLRDKFGMKRPEKGRQYWTLLSFFITLGSKKLV